MVDEVVKPKKLTITEADLLRWIEDTQMFQRIAGTPESSVEDLTADWVKMTPRAKRFNMENIQTHLAIQRAAIEAGKKRTN